MTTQQMQTFITSAVNATVASLRLPQGEQAPSGPQDYNGDSAGASTSSDRPDITRWNTGDVALFDLMYDGKSVDSAPSVEHTGKETYFRDVHLFVEQAIELAAVNGGDMIRNNLWPCLRGTALDWWTSEISDGERRLSKYRTANDIDEWVNLLRARFRQPSYLAQDAIFREKYTMTDAAHRREPREFAQRILRLARDAGMDSTKQQSNTMFNDTDLELRRDMKPPNATTSRSSPVKQSVYLHDFRERKGEKMTNPISKPGNISHAKR